MADTDDEVVTFNIESNVPQSSIFQRDNPAYLEGPLSAWELARSAVDLGGALLQAWRLANAATKLRHSVIVALVRRTLITAEGVRVLLERGLHEPAVALARTQLEIDLWVDMIHRDASDDLSHRLAAYHYLTYQRHGEGMLHNPRTRNERLASSSRVPEVIEVAKAYARQLESAVFDRVRADLAAGGNWHGLSGAEAAFKSVDRDADYHMEYHAATWFVHCLNIDWDFVGIDESTIHLRPAVDRDPSRILVSLGLSVLRLLGVLEIAVRELGYPTHEHFRVGSVVTYPDGSTERINAIDALRGLAVRQYPPFAPDEDGAPA